MPLHPDSDAFIQAILRDPADSTARLVFADWLDETGDPSNVAWARYIRLRDEIGRHPPDSFERSNREWHATNTAVLIEATVTVPLAVLVTSHALLRDFLPLDRVRVTLENAQIPREVLELVPEVLVRRRRMLPLHRDAWKVIVALTDTRDWDTVQQLDQLLGWGLNPEREVIWVLAAVDEVGAAIERHYGPPGPPDLSRFIRRVR